jgi:exo-1,4-beta-D-glucosaminidase
LSAPATASGTAVALTGKAPEPLSGGAHVAPGLDQFVEEAQPAMYEADRAQFEAYIDHSTDPVNPSTGTDFWLVNHAFPTLLWGLYNTDYDTNGGYFGAKKANESLHALYVFDNSAVADNNTVTLDNLSGATQSGLSVESIVHSFSGKVLDDQTATGITLPAQGVMNAVLRPNVPAATTPPTAAQTYFVELIMRQHGQVVDRNVYWVSTQQDHNSSGSPVPTFANADAFANLTELQQLQHTTLRVTASSHRQSGLSDDHNAVSDVTITNTGSTVAFFVRVDLRRGNRDGSELSGDNEVLPVSYSDNDITLWPGESQTIQVAYDSSKLAGATPVDSVFAWNVPYRDVASPSTWHGEIAQRDAAAQPGVTSFGLADGTPQQTGSARPGQANTRSVMLRLRERVSTAR